MIALDDLTAVSDAPSPPIDAVTDPLTMVIFGGTGDLARRKLLPALFRLCLDGRLPSSFSVVGVARRDQSDTRVGRPYGRPLHLTGHLLLTRKPLRHLLPMFTSIKLNFRIRKRMST